MVAQLVLENVGIRLPNRTLFEGVNWTLYEGMRVALAGRNGSGKSTLLKILANTLDPTEGKCNVVGSRRLRIGVLDQSLLDRAVLETQNQKDQSQNAVAFLDAKLLREEDSYIDMEWEIRKMLAGLGFEPEMMNQPIGELSGGWLLRVFIAAALLQKPQVLLLDEPTNHLDISSIQWLEEFLVNEYEGSLVLVTHDVELQKRTTDSLAILHGGKFYFRTHQKDYLTFKESLGEEKRIVERTIEATQKKIEENLEFAARFRAKAQTAARAQSKIKIAERLQEELNELQNRLQQIEGFAYALHFRFRHSDAGSRFPLSANGVSFRYETESALLLKNVSFDLKRGQTVAIMGDNGTGKTTLLNLLAARLTPSDGNVSVGSGVEIGYFGQHQLDELLLEDSLVDNLRAVAVGVSTEQLRGWLGAFGFSGSDEISKKAKVLSGGERARLALLRILVTPINLCLLDEPTNHLDVETKELLKNAIKEFQGTVAYVSHDRDFIRGSAERIFYLTHDHRWIDHLGDLDSFFAKYPELIRHLEGTPKPSTPGNIVEKPKSDGPQLSYEERKRIKNLTKSLEKKVQQAEQQIEELGSRKEFLRQELESPAFAQLSPDLQKSRYAEFSSLDRTIHDVMTQWEKWSAELDQLKNR